VFDLKIYAQDLFQEFIKHNQYDFANFYNIYVCTDSILNFLFSLFGTHVVGELGLVIQILKPG
jgi:hypothetical protein